MRILGLVAFGIVISFACGRWSSARADEIDDVVAKQMREKHIPGVSLAIILDGKIVRAHGYGFADEGRKTPVTTETLFQAGSISNAVSAVGVLRLVERHELEIDEDVNKKMRSWRVPENEFTTNE